MKLEAVTQDQVDSLARVLGNLGTLVAGLADADLSRGRGVLEGNDRCLWTTDGRRITVSAGGGAVIASVSHEPDPEAPPAGQF